MSHRYGARLRHRPAPRHDYARGSSHYARDDLRHGPLRNDRPAADYEGPHRINGSLHDRTRLRPDLPDDTQSAYPASGTDAITGVNTQNSAHDRQMHASEYLLQRPATSAIDLLKNYRVVYDPELDATLSKSERKTRHKKIHLQSAYVGTVRPADPRLRLGWAHYFNRPDMTSKKMPFKLLPQTRFVYDKDSLGAPPPCELVLWALPASVTEPYLVNFLESFGHAVRNVRFYNDPVNAVPLGVATFVFQGSLEMSLHLARSFVKRVHAECPKVDGAELKTALNDADGALFACKMRIAQDLVQKERKRRELVERERLEAQKQKELRAGPQTEARTKPPPPAENALPRPNTTTCSLLKNRVVDQGFFLPDDLVKYVKDRPYIHISDKYVSIKKISSLEVKKLLIKYDWTRVLVDKTGFYVVFNSLKECDRCFRNEDGARFFDIRLYMDLCVPANFDESTQAHKMTTTKSNRIVDEAMNMLVEDFQLFLKKDIRERIIAPVILDLLVPDKYPELMQELREKEREHAVKHATNAPQKPPPPLSYFGARSDDRDRYTSLLPSFTRKQGTRAYGRKIRRNFFPMQHALNFDDDDDESESDDELSRSETPLPVPKRDADPLDDEPRAKKSHLHAAVLAGDARDLDAYGLKYTPTETACPQPVYDEIEPQAGTVFDLKRLQETLRDDEDLELARRLFGGAPTASVKHPEYWAWKHRQPDAATVVSEEEALGELSERLECRTGAFRSEGYRKISDADKIEYLPHRRKVHKPLKTVQHDYEDGGAGSGPAAGNCNSVHSSRVSRANNRRFAADISAQKQILSTESDILNLNALNKRKKPVSFARSAIHNWGLYALEPIAAKEMIIEYVGESIRQQVAERREKSYLRTGIGSSYLFRIDENIVIDATKKGGIARFINHCCNPSCTAKIIKVDGKKRIVIYALKDIEANEELTYDYKFERETNDDERIRCLCNAPGCKGYLN
ncbi:histone H3-K4 methyltransferase Set1 [Metschnikowia bicuspidata]|uniref:Histone-lysine N-methyltransferase, H3 lysine-4 specific n=1 Tax=Metschnikowia bicuspidata TaxID=27322 RepID=A0A4V1J2N2_9ASCO|nr:histone H3-K4 methyltransferase Set1 [Metschnikowia bicuspidata]